MNTDKEIEGWKHWKPEKGIKDRDSRMVHSTGAPYAQYWAFKRNHTIGTDLLARLNHELSGHSKKLIDAYSEIDQRRFESGMNNKDLFRRKVYPILLEFGSFTLAKRMEEMIENEDINHAEMKDVFALIQGFLEYAIPKGINEKLMTVTDPEEVVKVFLDELNDFYPDEELWALMTYRNHVGDLMKTN